MSNSRLSWRLFCFRVTRTALVMTLLRPFSPAALILLAACGQRILPHVTPVPAPDRSSIETSLYLIGDAGAPKPGEPVLTALGSILDDHPEKSLVVFLGDNIYPRGLPPDGDPGRLEAELRLGAQLDVLAAHRVRGWFIPGNHDWARFSRGGWDAIRRQQAMIAARGLPDVAMVPVGGCPGPVVTDVGRARLVFLDTQWWLQGTPKPVTAADGCEEFSEDGVERALAAALSGAEGRQVVVMGHHPLSSGGEHGGFFDWKDHLFPLRQLKPWLWIPLPGVGSVYPMARNFGVTSQDIPGPRYQAMIRALTRAFRAAPPLVYAAGHDHALQVIEGGPARWQLVSGAGIFGHEGALTDVPGSRVALSDAGFMRLDFLSDGRVRLAVITADRAGRPTEVYARWIN